MGTVYAGTSTLLEVPVGLALAPGDYQVSFELGNAELGISEQLNSALVTVPEAPPTPLPANAAPVVPETQPDANVAPAAVDAPAAESPATAEVESASQSASAPWMIIAGIAAALVLGAGGAVLGISLMRRRHEPASPDPAGVGPSSEPDRVIPPAVTPAMARLAVTSAPTVQSETVRPEQQVVSPAPTVAPVMPVRAAARQPEQSNNRRPSTSVRQLLQASSALRSETATPGSSTSQGRS